jgi:queuine tRNA-ribosyltransferase
MDTERIIGADIMMALDECPPGQSDYEYAKKSLGMTQRWLDRCIKHFNETEPLYGYKQSLFPLSRVAHTKICDKRQLNL